jgi:cell division protein ZapE
MIVARRGVEQAEIIIKIMATVKEIHQQKIARGEIAPDPVQERVAQALSALQHALENPPPARFSLFRQKPAAPRGFYLWGGVGRGKSMMMDMFFSATGIRRKRRAHFHAFMLEIHDALHEMRTKRRRGEGGNLDGDLMACADKIAAEARLLCLDEFQVRDVADAMILGRLFAALFARGVCVVMTSNIPPDLLYENGLQRDRFLPFIRLLKERLDVVEFAGGQDYRLERLRDLQVYFWPDDEDARRELDRIFRVVADGDAGSPVEIEARGRVIEVPRAARDVCAFSFAELCERPKSAVDYLALVRRFHVFIVEGVPVMTDSDRNALLRFVTLIDTLYDHHARIALSAAAPPARLYAGGQHEGVFARTVSRLMEMQSREYRSA